MTASAIFTLTRDVPAAAALDQPAASPFADAEELDLSRTRRLRSTGERPVGAGWVVDGGHTEGARVEISGINMPGRVFCRPDGSTMGNVHVGVQIRSDPAQLVPAEGPEKLWKINVEVIRKDGAFDFRGPAVQGTRGARFIYLTWGNVGPGDEVEMLRRAKLMLDRIEPDLIEFTMEAGVLAAVVNLTGADGGPRCARVDPPGLAWSVPET